MSVSVEICYHCGRELDPDKLVLLELNCSTHEWVKPGTASWSDTDQSQGCWTFGKACARKVLKTQKCNWKGL